MKFKRVIEVVIIGGMLLPMLAGAVASLPSPPGDSLNVERILAILDRAVSWLFSIFLIFAVIMILLAAFKYLTSGGDSTRVKEATTAIIYAVVAIGVALLAAGLVGLVKQFLGTGAA